MLWTLVFIPASALHRTGNPGPGVLEFMFIFPTTAFEEVRYEFAAG